MWNTWGLWFNMSAHDTGANFPSDGNLTSLNQVHVMQRLGYYIKE
jgi:hypothetical protein